LICNSSFPSEEEAVVVMQWQKSKNKKNKKIKRGKEELKYN